MQPFVKPITACLVTMACLASIALVLASGTKNLVSPVFFDSRWEGGQFIAAVRLLSGEPIYPVHEIHGAATVYPPVTLLLFASGMKLFGNTILIPKIIAFLAFGFCLLGIAAVTFMLCRSLLYAAVSMGLFTALHYWTAFWYFNIRPDIFCCAFAIWGLVFAGKAEMDGWQQARLSLVAQFLFTLAAYSKHNFVLFPFIYILYCGYYKNIRWGLYHLAIFSAVTLCMAIAFNTGDNHLFACLFFMKNHPFQVSSIGIAIVLLFHYFKVVTPLLVFSGYTLMGHAKDTENMKIKRRLLALFLVTALGVGLPAFFKVGGYFNSFLLLSAAISISSAAGVERMADNFPLGANIKVPLLQMAVTIFILVSLPVNAVHFTRNLDNKIDELTPLVTHLKHYQGKVYVPCHNYLAYITGHGYDVDDGLVWGRGLAGAQIPKSISDKISARYFDQIIGRFYSQVKRNDINHLLFKTYQKLKPSPINQDWPVLVPKKENGVDP